MRSGLWSRSAGKRRRGGRYAAAVVDVLAKEFPNLADAGTAEVVRDEVARHAVEPGRAFECTLDDLTVANWRLRPHRVAPRVRVACHRLNPSESDIDREQRINEALALLPF